MLPALPMYPTAQPVGEEVAASLLVHAVLSLAVAHAVPVDDCVLPGWVLPESTPEVPCCARISMYSPAVAGVTPESGLYWLPLQTVVTNPGHSWPASPTGMAPSPFVPPSDE